MINRKEWAVPDLKKDKAALRDFYTNVYLVEDDDSEGLGPSGIERLGQLASVLESLTRRAS